MDCGPTCLKMIAKYHGQSYGLPFLREQCYIDKAGVSVKGISEAAELIGMRTLAVKVPLHTQKDSAYQPSLAEAPLPCIVHWNQNHFVVVYKITKNKVYIADPGSGKLGLSYADFKKSYNSQGENGIALLLETTPDFYEVSTAGESNRGIAYLLNYLKPHKRLLIQLILGLLLGTVFQLIFPFLTQSLVDIGIDQQNLNFIYLVLAGQLMLFLGQPLKESISVGFRTM